MEDSDLPSLIPYYFSNYLVHVYDMLTRNLDVNGAHRLCNRVVLNLDVKIITSLLDMAAQGTKTDREQSLKHQPIHHPQTEMNAAKGRGGKALRKVMALLPGPEMSYNPRGCTSVCQWPSQPE